MAASWLVWARTARPGTSSSSVIPRCCSTAEYRRARTISAMSSLDAVVIGAGQAGLAASHHLSSRGIEHVVLERGRIGEAWRTQRWDSFVLNTPRWMSRQPGEPEELSPEDNRDGFLSAAAWVATLEAAASADRAPIREGVSVTAVDQPKGGGFAVVGEGPEGGVEIETRAVVVASGVMNVPPIPALGASLPGHVQQLTAASYRRAVDLPPGAVLVIGSAQSGVQITEDLVRAGRAVFLATSSGGRLRRRQRSRDSLVWRGPAGGGGLPRGPTRDPPERRG